jgi:hypothetical protein
MKALGDRRHDVELPRVRHLDVDRVGADLERGIDVVTHAVADHPHRVRCGDREVRQHALERLRRLVIHDHHAIHRNHFQDTRRLDT